MNNGHSNPSPFNSLKRYVPLAVWAVVILVILAIPFKILSYGYLPGDDALRHAAKAVSGKSWSQILVLNGVYKIDHEFGWNLLLETVRLWTNWNAESLVIFSLVTLFLLVGWSALPWLKWPEAWLATLLLTTLVAAVAGRMTLGRPFLVTFAALLTLLFLWQKFRAAPPKTWMLLLATALFALGTFVHGVWYLWVLLLGAFFLAGEFRWFIGLGGCWIVGVFIGSACTGHPLEYPVQALKLALLAVGAHATVRTMATELQPFDGNVLAVAILGGMLVLRQLAKLNSVPLSRNPAFWLACLCWMLGFKVGRFWEDWGWPAMLVLITWDLQTLLQSRLAEDSFKRLGVTFGLAAALFLAVTNDADSRWSHTLSDRYLIAEKPELNGWMPDHGGIFYTADMTLFYQTFYANPTGDWRYMLGFEPTWMPKEDFEVYHSVLWNLGEVKAYDPWIKKMQPADRLVIRGARNAAPGIPQLEWYYSGVGIWIGRTPHTLTDGTPPPTVPATAKLETLTNAVPALNSAP